MDPDVDVFVMARFPIFCSGSPTVRIGLHFKRVATAWYTARNSQFLRCIVVSSPSAWRGKTLPEDGDRREGRADGGGAAGRHETSVAVVTLN